ncbi:hypothetical protein AA18895_1955 [Acetobacter ghanensis DSM 18895]|nr:hypothetical protein AA18895_1955 [Acetobacter ghanensis DSM 18895]
MPWQVKCDNPSAGGQYMLGELPVGQAAAKTMHQHKWQTCPSTHLTDMHRLPSQPEQEGFCLYILFYHAAIMPLLHLRGQTTALTC